MKLRTKVAQRIVAVGRRIVAAARDRKPKGYRPILGTASPKTVKGEKLGYFTAILYLAPATLSGVMNVCLGATADCIKACLNLQGRGKFTRTQLVRIAKTVFLHDHRELFLECLRYDIRRIIRQAATKEWRDANGRRRVGMVPVFRINGTSDLPWIALQMAREFPGVKFYDYTKLPKAELRVRDNYHLTYSYSGANLTECLRVLQHGVNVAVVFHVKKGQPLPEMWNGYRVIDGDVHDLRFLDERGVIVGLRAKGTSQKMQMAFIVQPDNGLIQIQGVAA